MSDYKRPCNCQWQHGCGPNLLCPVHGNKHHMASHIADLERQLAEAEREVERVRIERNMFMDKAQRPAVIHPHEILVARERYIDDKKNSYWDNELTVEASRKAFEAGWCAAMEVSDEW